MKKFTEKYIESEGSSIRFLVGQEDGKDAWFLLHIDSVKYSEYKAILKTGNFSVADYGEIISSGWGKPPSDKAVEAVITEYKKSLSAR